MTRPTLFFLLSLTATLYLSSAAYNVDDAKEFASLSALSYCDPSAILDWTCGPPCQNLTGYEVYFTQLFNVTTTETLSFTMVYHPSTKRFINAFRGSQGSVELLLEVLEGDAVDYPNITNALVDDYFYNHYMNILRPVFYPELQHAISVYPDYQYIFTGHSLGASLTTLAAFDALSTGILSSSQVIMYNYGMPRLGNIILSQAIEAAIPEIYRVVHWQDLVPHVPPCLVNITGDCVSSLGENEPSGKIAWPAWHLVQQMFYSEDNTNYTVCNGAEDKACADQFPYTQTSVNDHHYYMGIGLFCHGNSATSIAPLKEREDAATVHHVEVREPNRRRDLLTWASYVRD